jgi:hypothetical protein
VINPSSGPGGKPLPPGNDYVREVPKLNAHANVITIGYVLTGWCDRPMQTTIDDIDTYADWSKQAKGLGLQGIFLDETPDKFTPQRRDYLEHLQKYIKAKEGLGGNRWVSPPLHTASPFTSLLHSAAVTLYPCMHCYFQFPRKNFLTIKCNAQVVHNPGTPPERELIGTADVVCTCEEPYEVYKSDRIQNHLQWLHYDRSVVCYQISGVPLNKFEAATRELSRRAIWLFATDTVDDFYESFGKSWPAFIKLMAKIESQK